MEKYIAGIRTLLDLGHWSDAIDLAEVYHAVVKTDESLYYKALCYKKSGKVKSAYLILTKANRNHPESRLLLGECCFELAKYHEGELALLGSEITSSNKDQLLKIFSNDVFAATAAKLIGSIFEKTSRSKEAAGYFRISFELLPILSSSGHAFVRLDKNSTSTARAGFISNALQKFKPDHSKNIFTNNSDTNSHLGSLTHHFISSAIRETTNDKTTPSNGNFKTPQTRRVPPPVKKEPRRSTRLYSIENNETPATRPTITTANAPAKKIRRLDPEFGLDPVAKVLQEIIKASEFFNQYKLDQCISILNSLPEDLRCTGKVLCYIARALYEKTNYNESVLHYQEARKLEPYRLDGMEYYSSALWHLHKEVELSSLSKELMDLDQEAPETWCVMGNCYSLQKEHESAIKCLERAIKVDPNFAYAYTLSGYEYISVEKLDQAMTCFRAAVRLDPKHWNAWCGLGCIYYKNELYVNAELYYKKALKIAPSNPVLMCQLAVVQHACKRSDLAIETLTRALVVDPNNALCRFHRATIYSAIDKNQEALSELDELRRLVPKESMVYFLIGKIHKKTGNFHTALMNFSWATTLDPKGANNTIRDVIDKQHSGEDDVVVHRDHSMSSTSSST